MPSLLQDITTIWNMARQHREFYLRLENFDQLRCYAQPVVCRHNSLDDALNKARDKYRYWERKAKEGTDRATNAENERDEAKEDLRFPV